MKSFEDKKKILTIYNKLLNGKRGQNENYGSWVNCTLCNNKYLKELVFKKCHWDNKESTNYQQCKVCKLLFRNKDNGTK